MNVKPQDIRTGMFVYSFIHLNMSIDSNKWGQSLNSRLRVFFFLRKNMIAKNMSNVRIKKARVSVFFCCIKRMANQQIQIRSYINIDFDFSQETKTPAEFLEHDKREILFNSPITLSSSLPYMYIIYINFGIFHSMFADKWHTIVAYHLKMPDFPFYICLS